MEQSIYHDIAHIHQSLPLNERGTDYFVGDIHGKYSYLMKKLEKLAFNFDADRLICVGDIINRGDESEQLLELLNKPWFFSVQGNHEHMFLMCLKDNSKLPYFYSIGGLWLKKWIDKPKQIKYWRNLIRQHMPIFLSVQTNFGTIGISHADAPDDWQKVSDNELDESELAVSQWRRIKDVKDRQKVKSVIACVHGHTAVRKPKSVNNQLWIDTYYKQQKLTILTADKIITKTKSPWFGLPF